MDDPNTEPTRTGFLIVGAGSLGAQRAAAIAASPATELIAVHDVSRQASRAVVKRFGGEAIHELNDALGRGKVHAVIIATPHADHYRQVRAALEAGKHVLCEKPLTIRPEEARRLAALADELGLRLATGFNHRFYPPIRESLACFRTGLLGRVETVRAEIGHRAGADFLASWRTDLVRSGGGTLMDNGPHACDLIRLFLGEVVAAKGSRRLVPELPNGCEMEAFALFRDFDRGLAELRSSWSQPTGYLTVEIRGSAGWLRAETAPWRLVGELSDGRRLNRSYLSHRVAERLFRLRYGCERSLVEEIEAFVSCPPTLQRAEATGWDGCRVTEMIDAVYQSDATGREIEIAPPVVILPSSRRIRADTKRDES